ncbi:hypothetical protein FOA52_000502 [Chlamydomonas sp. UWO 241]|nr:hypothetical protein FOA52_000502 [Chlamydomonas sp. UWO 241]
METTRLLITSSTQVERTSAMSDFHTYAIDWDRDFIAFSVDGTEVTRVASSEWFSGSAPASPTAPFDRPLYLIINQAVGGQ